MPGRTSPTIILDIVRTREIVYRLVDGIRMIPELFVTITAVEIIGQQMLFSVVALRSTALRICVDLLHPLKHRSVDDSLMNILEDHPLIRVVRQPSLVAEVLGIGLEIDYITAILLISQDIPYRDAFPVIRLVDLLSASFDTSFFPICCRSQYLAFGQDTCDRFVAF